MARAYDWCSPWVYEDLTEPQIYGYSSQIDAIDQYHAQLQAAAIASRLAPEVAALMFGGGKTSKKR